MITQETKISQIEKTDSGLAIRLELCVLKDGEKIGSKFHRTVIDDVVDPLQQMEAVNLHLVAMNEPPLSAADIDEIRLFNELRLTLKGSPDRELGKPLAEAVAAKAKAKAQPAKGV